MQEISEDTIRQASQGSIESFETIYRTYSGFVYNVTYRVVNDMDDAQEVTQDVFLTVHRKLESFRGESSFKTWIYRIAVNLAINHAKKRSKEQDRTVEYEENMELSTPVNPIDEKMDRVGKEKVISMLLGSLNPDQRACLVLRDFEGLSYEEIAETLKVNINTVRSRLKRGRERLLALSKEVVKNAM
jgi:RNA polymerase sigma-70 factor (ECF subfamily)